MTLSIVIPIYNTGEIIDKSIGEVIAELNRLSAAYEILLCDDKSSDKSREKIKALMQKFHQIKGFFNESNKGLGFTLRRLFQEAQGEYIIYLDCDLPFGAAVIPHLFQKVQTKDIVLASRYGGEKNQVRFLRKAASRFYYVLCKFLFGIGIKDIGSGSVALRKKSLDKMQLKLNGFGVHAEIYLKAKKAGLMVEEWPYPSYKNSKGSFSLFKHGLGIIAETALLWRDEVLKEV